MARGRQGLVMKLLRLLLLAGLAIGAVASMGCGGRASASTKPTTPTTISIRYSHFQQPVVTVPAGQPVSIDLRNDDPIEHEWIVGTEEVHERHRLGTDPVHDQIPTEVTIPALSSKTTMVRFDVPGNYAFICHLPGHEAYGMKGILRVVAQ